MSDGEIHLVIGRNDFLKSEVVDSILSDTPDDSDLVEVDGASDTSSVIRAAIWETSPWGAGRTVVVRNADKADEDVVSPLSDGIPSGSTVILVSSDQSRHRKWFRTLNVDERHEVDTPKKWKIPEWLQERAASRGVQMDERLATAIHRNVGDDLRTLSMEIDKLVVGSDGKKVDAESVRSLLYRHAEFDPFDICRAWGLGRTDRALKLLVASRSRGGSAIRLIHVFENHVEKLLLARSLYDRGRRKEIPNALGIPQFIWREKVRAQVAHRRIGSLLDAQDLILEIECEAKSGGAAWALVEYFVAST